MNRSHTVSIYTFQTEDSYKVRASCSGCDWSVQAEGNQQTQVVIEAAGRKHRRTGK